MKMTRTMVVTTTAAGCPMSSNATESSMARPRKHCMRPDRGLVIRVVFCSRHLQACKNDVAALRMMLQ